MNRPSASSSSFVFGTWGAEVDRAAAMVTARAAIEAVRAAVEAVGEGGCGQVPA